MQTKGQERPPLLDKRGRLTQPSWATEDVFAYNKERMRRPGRRKEWEFYQVSNPYFSFQATYGHVAYAGNVGVTLIDFPTGERFRAGPLKLFPGDRFDLDFSAGEPHKLLYDDTGLYLAIDNDGETRRLECRSESFEVELLMPNDGDAIVMATPFRRKRQFYYNYKKDFLYLDGYIRCNGVDYPLDDETFAVLDSGRGVWPYRHSWVWGNGAALVGGHVLGLNIGWGFGDARAATENAIFWDGRIEKLDQVTEEADSPEPMSPRRFVSDDGRLDVAFEPVFDNYTHTNLLLAHTRCHQVYGRLYGDVYLEDGSAIELDGMHFFCEHAKNRW